MRIAYIFDAVYPWVKGGVEKRVYELSKRLVRRGHEVHWFGLQWWNGKSDVLMGGVHLHGIGRWENLYARGRRSIKEGFYFGIKTLTGLGGDFDVIDSQHPPYFHCFSAKMHSAMRGANLVITWHFVWRDYWLEYLGKKGVFGLLVEKLVAKLTNNNVAVSERVKEELEKIGVRGDVIVIPNGVDFRRVEIVKASTMESDILFAGRLVREKNLELLLRAMKLIKKYVPDIRCIIIGDGPERGRLEKLSSDLGLENNVRFLGQAESDEVYSYMKSSKVFALPSIREGLSVAVLEANACGLPVVTANYRGNFTASFVRNGENGFVTEPSEKCFAKAILIALNERKNMKWNCINYARRFDWDRITDQAEIFYRKLA